MHQTQRTDSLRRHGSRAAALLLLLLAAAPAAAADFPPVDPPADAARPDAPTVEERLSAWKHGDAGVQVVEPLLAARIQRLREDSPSFDLAWRELEAHGTPIVIGTREQLADVLPRDIRRSDAWAGITVAWGGRGLDRTAVGIRLEWLRELHRSFGNSEAVFLEALDGLLIHEVYGHLVPVVRANDARRTCGDPAPGERLGESCVGKRELALKRERHEVLAARLASRETLAAGGPQH